MDEGMGASWGPVREENRIETLDVLRGFAVFGILLANIFLFALPTLPSGTPAGEGLGDRAAALLVGIFIEGKFYTIFSLLFGMGLMLQSRRASEAGRPFAGICLRRLAILFLIGVAHAVFLFHADILAFYALVGTAALPFRRLKPNALLTSAGAVLICGLCVLTAYGFLNPQAPVPTEPDWARLAQSPAPEAPAPTGAPVAGEAAEPAISPVLAPLFAHAPALTGLSEQEFYAFMADQRRVFRSGSWNETARYRAISYFIVGMPLRVLFTSWQIMWLFLLGMYFVQKSLLTDPAERPGIYRRMIRIGLPVGGSLQLLGAGIKAWLPGDPYLLPAFYVCVYVGTLLMGLSYAGGVALLCAKKKEGSNGIRPLAAVGRTALTNYVGQSVVCGALFYGWGLGWFGQLGRAQALLLTLPIFGLQLLLSSLWLRHFHFGPLEWVWKTLTYGRPQPMKRR